VRSKNPTGRWQVASGFAAYYPTYWSTIRKEEVATPRGLIDIYRDIVKSLKANGREFRTLSGRRYWACRGLLDEFQGETVSLLGVGEYLVQS
jgi:hypothetical protein